MPTAIYHCAALESTRESQPRPQIGTYLMPQLSIPKFIAENREMFRDKPLTPRSIATKDAS